MALDRWCFWGEFGCLTDWNFFVCIPSRRINSVMSLAILTNRCPRLRLLPHRSTGKPVVRSCTGKLLNDCRGRYGKRGERPPFSTCWHRIRFRNCTSLGTCRTIRSREGKRSILKSEAGMLHSVSIIECQAQEPFAHLVNLR
jgi:hypothetical protein